MRAARLAPAAPRRQAGPAPSHRQRRRRFQQSAQRLGRPLARRRGRLLGADPRDARGQEDGTHAEARALGEGLRARASPACRKKGRTPKGRTPKGTHTKRGRTPKGTHTSPLGGATAGNPRLLGLGHAWLSNCGSGWRCAPRRGMWRGGRLPAIPTRGRGTPTGLGPEVADDEAFGLQARQQAHPPAEGELARVPAHAARAQACVAEAPPPGHVVRQPRRGERQVIPRPLLSQEQRRVYRVAVGWGRRGEQPQQPCVDARRGG